MTNDDQGWGWLKNKDDDHWKTRMTMTKICDDQVTIGDDHKWRSGDDHEWRSVTITDEDQWRWSWLTINKKHFWLPLEKVAKNVADKLVTPDILCLDDIGGFHENLTENVRILIEKVKIWMKRLTLGGTLHSSIHLISLCRLRNLHFMEILGKNDSKKDRKYLEWRVWRVNK